MSAVESSSAGQRAAKRDSSPGMIAAALHVTKALRNIVDAWPDDVYHEPVVAGRLLGRPVTYVVDPESIRRLLVDDAHKLVRDDAMSRALEPALGTGLLTSDGAEWRAQRRAAAPAFRPDRIRAFVPAMTRAAEATCRRWQTTGVPFVADLQSEMMRTAFHVVTPTVISGEEGFDAAAFGRALEIYLGQTNWKIAYGAMGAPAWLPHPGSVAGARAARVLRDMTKRVIAARRSRGAEGGDLLGALLSATDPDTGHGLTDEGLVDNVLTFVVAGHETTALVAAWTLRLVAQHPQVERRVLDEVARLPFHLDDPGSLESLAYTRQVVFEAMRLYPPAALLVRRAAQDLRVGGVNVPARGAIHIPVYALHRNRRLWTDPEVFDPDRFEPSQHSLRHKFAFLPFGGGPRVCIGMGMALTECLAIVATLLPRFRFEPIDARPPRSRLRVTLRPIGGLPMRIRVRGEA